MKRLYKLAIGVSAMAFLSVSGFAANAESSTQKPARGTNANAAVVLYTNPGFLAQSKGQAYNSYFDGIVTTETSKQLSQQELGGHSPWRANPIYVAVYGTQNFALGIDQKSETAKEFVGTYHGARVVYTLTSSAAEPATVVETGLKYGLTIDLYKPLHHKHHCITSTGSFMKSK